MPPCQTDDDDDDDDDNDDDGDEEEDGKHVKENRGNRNRSRLNGTTALITDGFFSSALAHLVHGTFSHFFISSFFFFLPSSFFFFISWCLGRPLKFAACLPALLL